MLNIARGEWDGQVTEEPVRVRMIRNLVFKYLCQILPLGKAYFQFLAMSG